MISIFGAGPASAIAAAFLTTVGGSSPALAQSVATPINQAVQTVTAPLQALPLASLVAANMSDDALDEQAQCLATAVYFEARGEPLDGQLAVANVVINRANSGRYPADWCSVVKQKAQFSFVRNRQFPRIDANCDAWARARAIARIAARDIAKALPSDVLWYHADYVAPSWGKRLSKVEKIGAHIFYRA